jgi:hypothetical protein
MEHLVSSNRIQILCQIFWKYPPIIISAQQCVIVKVPEVGKGSCGNSPVVISGFEFLPDEEAGVRGDFALYMDEGYTLQELLSCLEEVARRVNYLYEFGSWNPDDKPKKYRLECLVQNALISISPSGRILRHGTARLRETSVASTRTRFR